MSISRLNIKLNNSVLMPSLGLGVFKTTPQETFQSVSQAIDTGYRHIDTAAVYGNEKEVGVAVKQSSVARKDIFVTTKVWRDDIAAGYTTKAVERSLSLLGFDYIDQILLHWPEPSGRLYAWQQLETLYEQGLVKSIGVSNFMVRHLRELINHANILPAINQLEIHPFLQQREVVEFCNQINIAICAYSPLAKSKGLEHHLVNHIAERNSISPSQVLLSWNLSKGHAVIPKSTKLTRQQDNLNALNVELKEEDIRLLDSLEDGQTTGWDPRNVV